MAGWEPAGSEARAAGCPLEGSAGHPGPCGSASGQGGASSNPARAQGIWGRGEAPAQSPRLPPGLAAGGPASGGGHWGRGEGRKLRGWAGKPAAGGPQPFLPPPDSDSFPPTRAGFCAAFSAVLCSQRFIFFTFTAGGWSCLFPSPPPGLEGKARSPGGHPGWKALPWPGLAGLAAGGRGGPLMTLIPHPPLAHAAASPPVRLQPPRRTETTFGFLRAFAPADVTPLSPLCRPACSRGSPSSSS